MARLAVRPLTERMTDTNPQHPTLIVGGTGKTGRRVAERLTELGVPVRIGSRSAEPAFDWTDPTTWDASLHGVESAYVTYYPDLAMPGAADAIRAFCERAAASGLRRLVLLSGRGEPEAQRCEQIVQGYPFEWTCVRASMFSQNFDEYFLVDGVRSGVVAFPGRETPEPFIDVDDIADVVVAALTEAGHAGQVYEVTGPRLLTFADAVGEIEAAAGRSVRYVPVSRDEYVTGLVDEADVPEPDAQFLGDLFDAILDGRNAYVTNGVERAIGRPARDFRDYARAAAATGVWSA
jgi:uncharacterized protein YbjT (DUF2867 family)